MDITKLGADILSGAPGTSVDADTFSQALSGLLGSSGGGLLDSLGGVEGIFNAAGKLLG